MYSSDEEEPAAPAPAQVKPWRTAEADQARTSLSDILRALYVAALTAANKEESEGIIDKKQRKEKEEAIKDYYNPIFEKINSTYNMPELEARQTLLEVRNSAEPNEQRRREEAREIEQRRVIQESLARQEHEARLLAQHQAEAEARSRALAQDRAAKEAEFVAKEQHRAQSSAESNEKLRLAKELSAIEQQRAQSASELGEKSQFHSELESKHNQESEQQRAERERVINEVLESQRIEALRQEALRAQMERKEKSEHPHSQSASTRDAYRQQRSSQAKQYSPLSQIASQASRAASTHAELQGSSGIPEERRHFEVPHHTPVHESSYRVQESPSYALAMAEAQARARDFAKTPRAALPSGPVTRGDPNVPQTYSVIEPERAQYNKEIMNRAYKILNAPPMPGLSAEERFAFPDENELQPLMMARQHGVQIPHLERARNQAELAQMTMPQSHAIHEYMNPYRQHVVDRIAEEGNRNFNENILPALEGRFIKLGQHGSRRHQELSQRAARDIQKEISALQGQALASGYDSSVNQFNTDMARRLESGKMHAMLGQQHQASRLSDIAALREAEEQSRGFRQAQKDYQQHELERIHKHPREVLDAYSQLAQGNPYSTSTHHYKPRPPQSMHRNDWGNYGLGVLGNAGRQFGGPLVNQALGLFGLGGQG